MPTEEEVFLHWRTPWSSWSSSTSSSSSSSSSSWCRGSASGGDGVGDVADAPQFGVEVSAGRSLESAPGCLFSPFPSRSVFRPSARERVGRATATTWLCRLSPTPSAASAPPLSFRCLFSTPTAAPSIYSTTMCLDNETLLFQKISRSSRSRPVLLHRRATVPVNAENVEFGHPLIAITRGGAFFRARVKHAFNSLLQVDDGENFFFTRGEL